MGRNKICRVCGKEYIPCRSIRPADDVFNWRAIACSPQCGEEYFKQVAIARGDVPPEDPDKNKKKPKKESVFDKNAEIETFFNN